MTINLIPLSGAKLFYSCELLELDWKSSSNTSKFFHFVAMPAMDVFNGYLRLT